MDLFSRTMLACSAEAGLTTTALSRHVPLLRRNIRPGDQVSLLSRCVGSDGLSSGDHILMLTGDRLVVTRQSRLLGRVRLCLDAPVAAIENLRWSADPAGPGVELNFTILEGPGATEPHRWHFWLPASHAKRVWRVDALLARTFRRPKADARPADPPRPTHPVNPAVFVDLDQTENTVALVRTATTAGAAHPASPLPALNPRLVAQASHGERAHAEGAAPLVPSPFVEVGTRPSPSAFAAAGRAEELAGSMPRACTESVAHGAPSSGAILHEGAARPMSSPSAFLPPVVPVDAVAASALPGPGNAVDDNRPRLAPPQRTGFRPTGFETTLAAA
ncbi:MAG TPA: hypothetical protein VHG10_03110 [Glycomyces sp.]|nr:hypothetical protein [Glycomyces sp.]